MLSWQDNSNNEGGFLIEKTISGNCTSGFVEVARVGVNISLWADDLAQPGDCYRVAAFNNDGVSSYTNTAQVPTVQPPQPPPCVPKGKSGKCR
jgi:hypothetical protein